MRKTQTNILVVFANPRGTDPLRLGNEDRAIREAIKLCKYRDKFAITSLHATTIHDLARALLDQPYQIVQISGHSTERGLVLEKESGDKYVVPQQPLAALFQKYSAPKGPLSCVILNACYSLSLGKLTSLGVPYTIAMDGPVGDTASIEFSRGFYDALGAGCPVDTAYEEGLLRARLAAPGSPWNSRILKEGEVYEAEPQPFTNPLEGQVAGDASADVPSMPVSHSAALVNVFSKKLADNQGKVRLEWAKKLLTLEDSSLVPVILRRLEAEPEPSIRHWLGYALGLRGCELAPGTQSRNAVLTALQDAREKEENSFARRGIANGLQLIQGGD